MHRCKSNFVQNPDLVDAIEAELISAQHQYHRRYIEPDRRAFINFQSALPEEVQSADLESSDEELAGARSIGCWEEEDSWSNKKRLMNTDVSYDMNGTPEMDEQDLRHESETASMADENDRNGSFSNHKHTNMDTNAAVFRSRPLSQSMDQMMMEDEKRREWMKQHSNGVRQKQHFDHNPDVNSKIPGGIPNENSEKPPIQQQKQPKILSFAPQGPTAIDGRPPLPLDAKKLQQQQVQQAKSTQQQRQKMADKKKRFPIDEKKGTKVETVPETCRLRILQWIENGTRRFLWHLGRRLTSVPTLTVVIPLMMCALSTVGVIVRRDTLRMQTPFRTFYSEKDTANQMDFFNSSNPRYDAFQMAPNEGGAKAEFAVLLKTEDHNVLEEEVIDSYLRLRKKIEDIKIVNGQKILKYQTLCRKTQRDACQKDFVETLMTSGKTIKFHYPETDIPSALTKMDKSKIANNSSMTSFFIGNTFGGVETDQEGALAKAESLAMYFKLKQPANKADVKDSPMPNGVDILRLWDEEFQRLMNDEELAHSRGKAGSVNWWSYGAFANQVMATFEKIYLYLAASLGVFGIGCLAASLKSDNYSSKPGLGLAAAVTIALVVGGGWCVEIGITGYVNPAIFPAFFFIAATALHFMINTLQSWRKYCMIAMDPGERIRVILTWDSPCLLWTCMILCISYVVTAAVINMPYYRSVCQFLAAGSFLIIVLSLLLFTGAMYLSGKRELAGFKWFQCGKKINVEFPPPLIRRYHMRDVQLLQKKMRDEQAQPLRNLGEFAANVHARYVALLIFCIYLIFAAWGCSLTPIKLNQRQYIKSSTNVHKFLDDYQQYYGKYDNYLVLTFHDSVDYFDTRVKTAILDMLGWVETQEHVAEKTVSWLKEFVEFEKSSIYLINRDTFVPVVDLIFLKDGSPYQKYSTDIAFGRYREQIVASRMYVELNSVGLQRQLEIVKTLASKAAEASLPMSIKSPSVFLLDHDVQLAHTTITAVTVLIGMIGLLSFFIFAQPFLSLLTILTTCSVVVGTIGLSALWDVPVNALNVGTVLAAIVHSAALSMSCCYQYGNSGDLTAVRRMAFTFQSWLPGAIWSSGIGLTAFAPLLFIECQIIQHLSKIVLCHFLSILIHVTVFLPPCLVLLTTSVPSCCSLAKRMCEDSLCVCCSSDEDATSIYYIPTGGRPLDPTYVQQFYQLKFREDILPPPPVQPLPAPPVREMLMPPPASSLAGSAAHMTRPQSEQRCMSPQPMFDSRLHSARSSMQRQGLGNGPNASAKVYRYGSNGNDFEEIMRARSARSAMNKRHLSPDISDPAHRSRHASPDALTAGRRKRATTTSPLAERRQRLESEEIYHEPSDPDTLSMRTANTEINKQPPTLNSCSSSQPGAMDSDEENIPTRKQTRSLKPYESRLVETDNGQQKNKITYAKWSKEIPLDPFTTERVTAEKYTIEGDGATIDLPPDWKRFWIKGNLRRQALTGNANANAPEIGMVPTADHHIPMHPHPHPQQMPNPAPQAPGQHFRPPPPGYRHPPPGHGQRPDGTQIMMPPYGAPPPLPPRPPYGLPRAPAYRAQPQAHFRKTPAWMY